MNYYSFTEEFPSSKLKKITDFFSIFIFLWPFTVSSSKSIKKFFIIYLSCSILFIIYVRKKKKSKWKWLFKFVDWPLRKFLELFPMLLFWIFHQHHKEKLQRTTKIHHQKFIRISQRSIIIVTTIMSQLPKGKDALSFNSSDKN